jgi:hypothetical protein
LRDVLGVVFSLELEWERELEPLELELLLLLMERWGAAGERNPSSGMAARDTRKLQDGDW